MSSPCIAEPNVQRWALAIHGGAGIINATEEEWISGALDGLHAALDAGEAVLADGGAAIDAVVAAVRVLEDDPHFNAGVLLVAHLLMTLHCCSYFCLCVLTAATHHNLQCAKGCSLHCRRRFSAYCKWRS